MNTRHVLPGLSSFPHDSRKEKEKETASSKTPLVIDSSFTREKRGLAESPTSSSEVNSIKRVRGSDPEKHIESAGGLPSCAAPSSELQWPDPELSIGISCGQLGKYQCWEAKDPVRELCGRLCCEAKDVLDQHSEYLHENETSPFSFMFGLFMIGLEESKSDPTLLLSCEFKTPRKKAVKLIRESGILCNYPGVLLASSSRSPITVGLVSPLSALGAVDKDFVFFSPPVTNEEGRHDNVCGRPIHVMEVWGHYNMHSASLSQKATIGGFVRLWNSEHEGVYCGLTVAHAFEDGLEAADDNDVEIEFGFDGEEIKDEAESDCGSSIKSHSLGSESHTSSLDSTYLDSNPANPNGIGNLLASSLDGEHPDLDWALIEIDQPHTQPANIISLDSTGECSLYFEQIVTTAFSEVSILAVTRSGVQTGVLSGIPTFYKSAFGNDFEEVWTVRLDGPLASGDSGCWIIDPESGDLYGHLVAGSSESQVGFIIPAKRIFADIKLQLGGTLELATISNAASQTPVKPRGKEICQKLPALRMNQSKDELLRNLGMSEEIFNQMDEDAFHIYQSLILSGTCLKKYISKISSHITWNDIEDKAKYEAMVTLSTDGTLETQPYWDLGTPSGNCPNWIARWFLSRQFKNGYLGGSKRHVGAHVEDVDYMFGPGVVIGAPPVN